MFSAQIFISYAHIDNEGTDPSKRWVDRLLAHLQPLALNGHAVAWSDKNIEIGEDWQSKIQESLESAKVAVLLASPAFLASEYIRSSELPVLFQRASDHGVIILPVILRPCLFRASRFKYPDSACGPEEFSLASLQASNPPNRALSEMSESEQDRLFVGLAERILEIVRPDEEEERQLQDVSPKSETDQVYRVRQTPDLRTRHQMIKRVRQIWIQGVLRQPVYSMPRLDLPLTNEPQVIERPFELVVRQPEVDPQLLSPAARPSMVFDDLEQALLILGSPGAGKTTMLLELVKDLLDRAERNPLFPIPMVFNLSSWVIERLPLTEWLVAELNKNYSIPRKIALEWVENDRIAPMLDGLDEVAQGQRQECVQNINAYRMEHGLVPIAVCSRLSDYERLVIRLKLHGAIVVQPLERSLIERYLAHADQSLCGLKYALKFDESLWELLDTPLMVGVAALAYQELSLAEQVEPVEKLTLEERRRYLFAIYVEKMLQRSGRTEFHVKTRPFAQDSFKRQVAWLANVMQREGQTEFHLSWMQPSYLLGQAQRRFFRVAVGIVSGLISGIFVGLLSGWEKGFAVGMLFGSLSLIKSPLIGGLMLGLLVFLESLATGELEFALVSGLLLIPFGWVAVKAIGYTGAIRPVEVLNWSRRNAEIGAKSGLAIGYFLGGVRGSLVGVVFGAVIGGLSKRKFLSKTTPNAEIHASMIHGAAGIVLGAIGGILISGVGFARFSLPDPPLSIIMDQMTTFALLGGFYFGGLAVIQHYVLRFIISFKKYAPWNFVAFLESGVDLLYLRKVGGGYIFVHRSLQEYFASLYPPGSGSTETN